ncbi:hypothetical protein HPB50_003532 [Hyalomma asiaticum]|uniref:Uncharacterized protein n=1 Tax=Hyalomma asiaticum TaxID=266040 RepID=A0ACB7SKB1_HYAAI|nr:hypothetical protein HPB50_003532 [Hyalomma asiaticum]
MTTDAVARRARKLKAMLTFGSTSSGPSGWPCYLEASLTRLGALLKKPNKAAGGEHRCDLLLNATWETQVTSATSLSDNCGADSSSPRSRPFVERCDAKNVRCCRPPEQRRRRSSGPQYVEERLSQRSFHCFHLLVQAGCTVWLQHFLQPLHVCPYRVGGTLRRWLYTRDDMMISYDAALTVQRHSSQSSAKGLLPGDDDSASQLSRIVVVEVACVSSSVPSRGRSHRCSSAAAVGGVLRTANSGVRLAFRQQGETLGPLLVGQKGSAAISFFVRVDAGSVGVSRTCSPTSVPA